MINDTRQILLECSNKSRRQNAIQTSLCLGYSKLNNFQARILSVNKTLHVYSSRQTSNTQKMERQVGQGARPLIQTSGFCWFCFDAKILPIQRAHLNFFHIHFRLQCLII
jgi:hypothetical protein